MRPFNFFVLYFFQFTYTGYTGWHVEKYPGRTLKDKRVTNPIPEGKQEIDAFGDARQPMNQPLGTERSVDEEGSSLIKRIKYLWDVGN